MLPAPLRPGLASQSGADGERPGKYGALWEEETFNLPSIPALKSGALQGAGQSSTKIRDRSPLTNGCEQEDPSVLLSFLNPKIPDQGLHHYPVRLPFFRSYLHPPPHQGAQYGSHLPRRKFQSLLEVALSLFKAEEMRCGRGAVCR